MKIAQVAPLIESCPPALYGGTERVVSYLSEALVEAGHEVTMFASGDSKTRAQLMPVVPRALRLAGDIDPLPYMMIQLAQVARSAHLFDVIHFHWEFLHFPQFHMIKGPPVVTTHHGRLDHPYMPDIVRAFPTMPMVSISDSQRRPIRNANWCATIDHGLPLDLLHPGPGDGGYLAFLGRVSPLKRVDRAVEIARRVGMPLKVAAKIDTIDRDYFDREIAPLFAEPFVEYVGEVDERQKDEFLGKAAALLFPIDWPEPFGLVMIEAMATGTPVIAWDEGSAREVVDEGLTGFVVDDIDEAAEATRAALALDRDAVRATFEERFSVARMAEEYVALYERLIGETAGASGSPRIARPVSPSVGAS